MTMIRIQHATRIRIQHVTTIQIQHVHEDGGRSGHHYVLTKDVCVLKKAKDTQDINS